MRWHRADNYLCSAKPVLEVIGWTNVLRYGHAGEKKLIDPASGNGFTDFFFMRPKADTVWALPAEHNCKRRPPCPRANDGDFAHARICLSRIGYS